jgi:hypothetical protein
LKERDRTISCRRDEQAEKGKKKSSFIIRTSDCLMKKLKKKKNQSGKGRKEKQKEEENSCIAKLS